MITRCVAACWIVYPPGDGVLCPCERNKPDPGPFVPDRDRAQPRRVQEIGQHTNGLAQVSLRRRESREQSEWERYVRALHGGER